MDKIKSDNRIHSFSDKKTSDAYSANFHSASSGRHDVIIDAFSKATNTIVTDAENDLAKIQVEIGKFLGFKPAKNS